MRDPRLRLDVTFAFAVRMRPLRLILEREVRIWRPPRLTLERKVYVWEVRVWEVRV